MVKNFPFKTSTDIRNAFKIPYFLSFHHPFVLHTIYIHPTISRIVVSNKRVHTNSFHLLKIHITKRAVVSRVFYFQLSKEPTESKHRGINSEKGEIMWAKCDSNDLEISIMLLKWFLLPISAERFSWISHCLCGWSYKLPFKWENKL